MPAIPVQVLILGDPILTIAPNTFFYIFTDYSVLMKKLIKWNGGHFGKWPPHLCTAQFPVPPYLELIRKRFSTRIAILEIL